METDERVLRQRLREELSSFAVPPTPVGTVMRRGQAIRMRRRTFAAAGVTAAGAALAAAVSAQVFASVTPTAAAGLGGRKQPSASRAASAGVFASGTASGRRWRLTVANIGGAGPACLPAVMLNGHTGDVLPRPRGNAQPVSYPAFLPSAPGFGGTGFAFVQVAPAITSVTISAAGGAQRGSPVTVFACGYRYRLAGFAVSGLRRGITGITAQSPRGGESWAPPAGLFPSGRPQPGMWANPEDQPPATPTPTALIGIGQADGRTWSIGTSLGAAGQCYTSRPARKIMPEPVTDCVPVEAPPRGLSLVRLALSLSSPSALTGYVALVSPRAAYALVTFAGGTPRRVAVHRVYGRGYLVVAVPRGQKVTRLAVFGTAGPPLAVTWHLPAGN